MSVTSLGKLARAGRNFELTWRYGFNLAPTLSYKLGSRHLSGEARRVHDELNREGVAITSADLLLENQAVFSELRESVAALEREQAEALAQKRIAANTSTVIGEKTFNVELLGSRPVLDPQCVYARFALLQPILQIANAYFGMYTHLRYYNVWHTFATQTEARESQLWHHDREDHFILKVFVYFSEVDDAAGPFTYAAGSHLKKRLGRQPNHFVEGGVCRSTDQQMAEVVPQERWVKATGPKGTIVFADTRGYHKGGLAREHDRLIYLCMFTSQASQSEELFIPPCKVEPPADKAAFFALSKHFRNGTF
jgi:hypothetical protein